MTLAVLFPGQGSQFVGMGADLFESRPDLLGESADEILGWSLRDVCLDGPIEALTETDRAQPALYALSYALWEAIAERIPTPAASAGHSLGEYTALAAAGVFDYATGLDLVARRGRAMAEAGTSEDSGMAALLGADPDKAEEIAATRRAKGGRLTVANLNGPGQVVVAGGVDDLDWLEENVGSLGVRRAVRLNVAGAFHSPFMETAERVVHSAVDSVTLAEPRFPVYANVSASPFEVESAAEILGAQVVSPVRFEETLVAMAQTGVDVFVHVGPGDVTAKMAKRSAPDAETLVVSELGGIDEVVAAMSTMSSQTAQDSMESK